MLNLFINHEKKLNELPVKSQVLAMVKCFLGRIICAFLSENARQFFYAIRQKSQNISCSASRVFIGKLATSRTPNLPFSFTLIQFVGSA